eukprot:CAMPEP_0180250860 /NCGR_PEP_ID=MMETSP0987-20121128/38117_1 /TAXON_ID=697907 /ORGANISM="non described non described, Strain CCMP2293" /LENGTH=98 /DNA_ID=CAMNT_0022219339 /DNA_START=236 /DNA_END=528 /DNA_ORIENTATION=-
MNAPLSRITQSQTITSASLSVLSAAFAEPQIRDRRIRADAVSPTWMAWVAASKSLLSSTTSVALPDTSIPTRGRNSPTSVTVPATTQSLSSMLASPPA